MPKSKSRSKKRKSSSTPYKLNTVHSLLIISAISFLLLVISVNVQTTQFLTANSTQDVLGDDEDNSGNQDEDKFNEDNSDENKDENNEEEKRNEELKKEEEKKIEQEKKQESQSSKSKSFLPKPSKSAISPIANDDNIDEDEDVSDEDSLESEQETEIETADGQKIKTKVKNGITTKIEIERGELKLKYEYKNGQLELKVENEDGEEVDLDEDELNELEVETETELEDEGVEVEAISEDTMAFTKNQFSAITNFPLSIDVGTNLLILSTPEGQRIVTVLPDQAIQSLLETGIVNTIDTSLDAQVLDQLGSSNGVIKLELKNKDIVYRIKGKKEHKILGLIPVSSPTTAFVSANSGDVVAQERSVLTSFVDLISP